ncbi:leucine-rich repeat domain-containing protein [Actinophytocola gossypii]|uniref:non-specific serine/threonine protein kinase n=1 Tax=Actinophytocola gossypii TaxID=2812003 RepID=A0ABT2J1Y4_9PSEU|nr:leucine-rich repeat domain-containing protein [Actinophytocola gossypii]MCT2581872.1 leucine-rich repeat domain-containing protein [Actinophytocola gossypii]
MGAHVPFGTDGAHRRIERARDEGHTSLDLGNLWLTQVPPELAELPDLAELHLNGNRLAEVPAWLGDLTGLSTLDLNDNRLSALPPELGRLPLADLRLNGNRLTELPDSLATATGLTRLDLDNNRFDGVPDWLGGLTNLRRLDLGRCRLTRVPDWLRGLRQLTELWLNHNRLTDLPDWVGELTTLTSFHLNDNRFAILPPKLGDLTGLTMLGLQGCGLESVPEWVAGLTGLRELGLADNRLVELPPWFGDLTALTTVELHNNRFEVVPPQLAALPQLSNLDLGWNRLTELPDWFACLTHLTELHLRYNRFREVPAAVRALTGLTTLSLNGCRIDTLPDWLTDLTGLKTLWLNNNDLSALPDRIGRLTNLDHLSVGNNRLTDLPEGMASLSELTRLWVDGNRLTEVPGCVAALTGLTSLGIGGNRITALPEWLGGLTELDLLRLDGCQLVEVPEWVRGLRRLTKLHLANNALTELPEWIGDLSGLTHLWLDGNPLSALPDGLAELSGLTSLSVRNCQLTEVPRWLPGMTGLDQLTLDNNPLGTLPDTLGELVGLTALDLTECGLTEVPAWLRRLTGLTALTLSRNSLTELPEWISELSGLVALVVDGNELSSLPRSITALTELTMVWFDDCTGVERLSGLPKLHSLSLARCGLTELPEWTRSLTDLTTLFLHENSLTELPEWISELDGLSTLWLNENQLTGLPDRIGDLTGLTSLRLDDNRLSSLPGSFGALTGLNELPLDNNRLVALPDSVGDLSGLTTVNVNGNQLTELPDGLSALTRLRVLHANNNQLRTLPDWLPELPNLTQVSVSANPLVSPPPEIATAGSESLMAFIRARQEGSAEQWLSKLLVVGEGGVGKTSAVRALAGDPHDPDEPSTHGLMVKELTVPHPDHPDVHMRLSAWDFGGQQIYHATHQFFLTNRSLFLLLWNSRLGWEQGKLRYWLDIIAARAPASPVVLVATHLTDRPVDLPLSELRQEYPNIVDSLALDNATRAGVDALGARLAECAARLPLMGSQWPVSWLAAADAVRGAEENHVTPDRMWELMAGAGVRDPDQQRYLAVALHELGDILYYSDDPELSQIVVLRPEWVNDHISRVLDSDRVAAGHGLLTRRHLDELWSGLDRGLRDHFLGMMDKYDLSYRIEGGRTGDVSLVVERLQWDPPDYQPEWDEIGRRDNTREIRVLYRLNTMPPGIPTWFIARSHRFSRAMHWRTGALLGHGDGQHLALVRANRHRNTVELAVRGPSPVGFFSILDDGLNLTLERFPGLHITRQVPCPCRDHEPVPCQELFDYEDLRTRMNRTPPRDEIECRKSYEFVSVPQLLLGLAPSERDVARTGLEQITAALARIDDKLDAQGIYVQRMFLKLQRLAQTQQEARCPSVFAIVPTGKRKLAGSAYEIRLYCEEPGAWHRLPDRAGCYPITQPAEWFRKVGPYLQHLMVALKHVAPLAGPVLGVTVDKLDEQVKADCDLMKELVSQLPDEIRHEPELSIMDAVQTGPAARAVHDADFRALQAMLTRLDPDQEWGGLSRTTTPEGLTLYLCADHVAGYHQTGR